MERVAMRILILALALAMLGPAACVTTSTGESTGRQRNLITLEELEPFQQFTAYYAIRQLRPNWLQGRGALSVSDPRDVTPKVAVDGMPRGELGQLRTISAHLIKEIRFLTSADATTRYGTGYAGGVIEIITR
jgi:hypothetical protein